VKVDEITVVDLFLFDHTIQWESGVLLVDRLHQTTFPHMTILGDESSQSHLKVKEISTEIETLYLKNNVAFELLTTKPEEMRLFHQGNLSISVVDSQHHPMLIIRDFADIRDITLNVEVIGRTLDVRLPIFEADQM